LVGGRVGGEERCEADPSAGERVDDVLVRLGGLHRHGHGGGRSFQLGKGAGQRFPAAGEAGTGAVGFVLAAAGQGHLQQGRSYRGEQRRDEQGQRVGMAVLVVVASESGAPHGHVGHEADAGGDRRGDGADEHVAIGDVGELMGEHAP
jgi:hypothetical protein